MKNNITPLNPAISNNKQSNFTRRLLAIAALTLGLLGGASSAQAQQFRTGVNLSVIQQPGYAYFNPVQQQYLWAMQQRQNALSNFGTAINLQAAKMNAHRLQIESIHRAFHAKQQAMLHFQRAQQWRAQQNTVLNRVNHNGANMQHRR